MNAPLSDPKLSAGSPSTQLYAMVDAAGVVVGLVEWDGVGEFDQRHLKYIPAQGAQIGWTYGAGIFNEPEDVPW